MQDVEARSTIPLDLAQLYEDDFYAWTQRQAEAIKSGRFDRLDAGNLAEEVESLGRSQASSLESAYRLICLHLLKRMVQPERSSRSWTLTIGRERLNAARLLRQNPGLKPKRLELFGSAYADARLEAALETGLPRERFPTEAPFTLDQISDEAFLADPVAPKS